MSRESVNDETPTGAVCLSVCPSLCLFSQTCIAKHESNGIDIIIALIVNPINPLGKDRLDLVLELKVSTRGLQGLLPRLAAAITEKTPVILTVCRKVNHP